MTFKVQYTKSMKKAVVFNEDAIFTVYAVRHRKNEEGFDETMFLFCDGEYWYWEDSDSYAPYIED